MQTGYKSKSVAKNELNDCYSNFSDSVLVAIKTCVANKQLDSTMALDTDNFFQSSMIYLTL